MKEQNEQLNAEEVVKFLSSKGIASMEQIQGLVEPALFTIIPQNIKERKDLSANAKILYGEIMALARREGFCYATNQYIAEGMGLSRSSIPALLKELKDKELIRVEIRRSGDGTYRRIVLNPINYLQKSTSRKKKSKKKGKNEEEVSPDKDRGGSPTGTGGLAEERGQSIYRQSIYRDKDNMSYDILAKQSFAGDLEKHHKDISLEERKKPPTPYSARPLPPPLPPNELTPETIPKAEKVNLNEIIDLFKSINPSYTRLYSNKTQREALSRLVDQYGVEGIYKIMEYLPKTNNMKYAPVITTPIELENKMGRLILFMKKHQEEKLKNNILKL